MRSPRCYASVIDERTNEFTLMLEDLGSHRCVSQADGCDLDEARLVARSLADFHATWWGRTDELSTPVVSIGSPRQLDDVVDTFARSWPTCRRAGRRSHPPAGAGAIGDRWATRRPEPDPPPGTRRAPLCHGDFRLDNLRFASGDEVIAFDWQLLTLANGVTDLAYFVSQSVRTDCTPRRTTGRCSTCTCAQPRRPRRRLRRRRCLGGVPHGGAGDDHLPGHPLRRLRGPGAARAAHDRGDARPGGRHDQRPRSVGRARRPLSWWSAWLTGWG